MNQYIPLHNHDEFSLLDGATTTERLVKRAVKLDMPALAISNHGVLGGSLRHYLVCQEHGIKPIFAMEGYVNNHRLKDVPGLIKNTSDSVRKEKLIKFREEKFRSSPHFLIIAKNQTGFQNLIKISNDAHLNGFYHRPRTDIDFLARHSKGLVFSTACLGGHFARLLEQDEWDQAVLEFNQLRDSIGTENLFVEIIPLSSEMSIESNKLLIEFARQVKAPILITGDAHFSKKKDALVQKVLMLMRQKKTLEDLKSGNAWTYDNTDLYLKSFKDLKRTWDQFYGWAPHEVFEEGIRNSILIADRVEEFCPAQASIPTYESSNGLSANEQLTRACIRELKKLQLPTEYKSRLKRELTLIRSRQFSDYFLIYQDVVKWAKNQGIRVGPGRGSAGGCLVAYLLDITEIDPIKHDLLFERFMDPGRPDPPDIDVDFEPEKRNLVKDYIFKRFVNAATIGTYSRMQVKAVIKDVGRVFGSAPQDMNAITASLPFRADDLSWKELLKSSELLRGWAKEHPEAFYIAGRLRGQIAHRSKHAAGVVITLDPIEEVLPIHRIDGERVVAWPDSDYYRELSRMGFLKWDVLGISHLSIISRTLEYVQEITGEKINLSQIPLDDKRALKIAEKGNTDGIFQFGTPTAKRLLKLIGVDSFEDLTAITAIGRPGPINAGYPAIYAKRKRGKEEFEIYPVLRDILGPTYGLIIYQEQIMKIGLVFGFSLEEVNYFRKVIGKKRDPEELEPFKKRFIDGATSKDLDEKEANQLWEDILGFAAYGFNKSHATAYALIAYQELYLKSRYPKEFMAALLSLAPNKKQAGEKIERQYIRDAFRMGLWVRPPDVNSSRADYSFTPQLRMGLSFIKNIGNAAEEIVACAPYESLEDFYERINKRKVNKRVVEALINSGAFDRLSDKKFPWDKRRQLRELFYELRSKKETVEKGSHKPRAVLLREASTIGSPLTSLALLRPLRASSKVPPLSRIIKRSCGILLGVVAKIKEHKTKNGGVMAFIMVEDETATLDLTIWPEQWNKFDAEVGDLISCRYKREESYNQRYGKFSFFPIGRVNITNDVLRRHKWELRKMRGKKVRSP